MEGSTPRQDPGPEVEFIILADHAEVINNKLYVMGGGWNQMALPRFGVPIPLPLALSIEVPWESTNQQHTWDLSIHAADGAVLAQMEGGFAMGRPPTLPEGATQRAMLALTVPVTLPSPATYGIEVGIDGLVSKEATFHALQAVPPPAPNPATA